MSEKEKANPLTMTIFRSSEQVSTLLQGETVILHVQSGKYYNLNPVGSRIWELIEQPVTIQSIIHVIESEYDVEHERCKADVLAVITSMQAAGLVQKMEENAGTA